MLEKQTNKQTLDSSLGECLDYLRPSSENKLHFPQDVCVSDFKIQPPVAKCNIYLVKVPYREGKDHSRRPDQDTGAVGKHSLHGRGYKLLLGTKRERLPRGSADFETS